jgi:hypothetical protein
MKEPMVTDDGIICFPRIVTEWQAICYLIVWYEAHKSTRPAEKCLFKQLKSEIFDTCQITNLTDIAASPLYAKFLTDHLYLEIQFRRTLARWQGNATNIDEEMETIWLLESALAALDGVPTAK